MTYLGFFYYQEQVLRDLEKRLHQVVQQLDIANQTKDKILKEKVSTSYTNVNVLFAVTRIA